MAGWLAVIDGGEQMADQSEDRAPSSPPVGRPVRARRLMDRAEAVAGQLGEQLEGRRPWRRPGQIMMSAITLGFFTVVIPLALASESWDSYQLEYRGSVGQVVVVEDLTGYRCGCAEVHYLDRPASTVYDLRMEGPASPGSTVSVRYLPGERGVLRLASERGWNWAPAAVAPAVLVLGVLLVLVELHSYRRARDYHSRQRQRRGSG